jgi:HEAT repeat protein
MRAICILHRLFSVPPRLCVSALKTSDVWAARRLSITALSLSLLTGCADGPIPETKVLNPWVRKQWAEDEQRITTFHRKVADLAELRKKAASMSQAEREDTAVNLAARLKEEKYAVLRTEFVRTLAALQTPVAQQAVLASVTDEDSSVRVLALKALGHKPTSEGYEALANAVTNDSDPDVRVVAARELSKFRAFDATKALRPALDDRDPALQLVAMQSLETLDGHSEYRRNPAVWREHLDGGNPAPPPGPTIAELAKQYWNWF